MGKGPPNQPEKGDQCKLRGRSRVGLVLKQDCDGGDTVTVLWHDTGSKMLCHRYELEKIEGDV